MRNRRARRFGAAALAVGVVVAAPAAAHARALPDASSPLPGGSFRGKTELGKRLKIRVATNGPNGAIAGRLTVACAGARARFHTSDGSFVATRRNPRGDVVFRARGRFTSVERVQGRVTTVAGSGRCAPARFAAKLASSSGVHSKAITYGPYDVDPMGMMGGAMQTMSFWKSDVERPCSDCYLVAMVPDLVYRNGRAANFDTDAMLHHFVFFNAARTDPTCAGRPLGNIGERFFASGNERTIIALPRGYGYRVMPGDRWRLLADLMNMADRMQTYYVKVTFFYVKAPARLRSVTPLWLDINNCGNSEYSIPAGRSDTHWDYRVPASLAGKLVAMGGHQHDGGVRIKTTDAGRTICTSRAGYGRNPSYMGHIESMSGCLGTPLARIHAGDTLRLHSIYNSRTAQDDVMGIMLAYVDTRAGP
jgi:Stress up-regulated Nod 19